VGRCGRENAAGAKAQLILLAFIGPAEAVPLLQSQSEMSFSSAYEAVPLLQSNSEMSFSSAG
jgi:hypothetical protein